MARFLLALAALLPAQTSPLQDGLKCIDTNNQCLEWAWKGECDRNEAFMKSTCGLACGVCSRNATAQSLTPDGLLDGNLEPVPEGLSGVLPDPAGRWDGVVKNVMAAMTRSAPGEHNGVSLSVRHGASVGAVDVFWMSAGESTRKPNDKGAKMFGLEPGHAANLQTFLGHVFRVADAASGATLSSFRVLKNRPLYELTDTAIETYASEEWCRDSDASCPARASRNECSSSPGWMIMKCSRSCETCHLRDPNLRCRRDLLNVKQTPGLRPGELGALFASLREKWPQFNVTIHSKPGGDPEHPELDVADGPWIATFDNFISEDEGRRIIGTVDRQFSRSTDQGAVDKYGEQQKVVSTSRTSENAWCTGACETNPATRAVMERIQAVTGIPTENYESFQVLRYTLGQEYRAHHDMSRGDNRLACGPRVYTFFLYLSDVEEGGETEFPIVRRPSGATVKVKPKRGSALLWPSVTDADPSAQDPRTRHAALPVKAGTKFAANAWIHMFDYEEPNAWGCTGAFD